MLALRSNRTIANSTVFKTSTAPVLPGIVNRNSVSLPRKCLFSTASTAKDTSPTDHDSHAQSESFGKAFYITIAGVIGTLSLYKFSSSTSELSSSESSFLTRAISKFHSKRQVWEHRNAIHTAMVEQAAADRSLFQDSVRSNIVPIKFPEVLNSGAPWNQEAGWAHGDLATVKATMEVRRERIAEQVREKIANAGVQH